MAEKKGKPAKGKQRAAPAAKRQKRAAASERPPESAENFEHVIRRLSIARDRGPAGR